jgi:arylsulfatase A-like enzyme
MYEGGIRVPFLVRWKGKIQPGESAQIITFWDFLPTVCELLQTASPPAIDGLSFLPTLLGKPKEQKQHDYLYWEFFERGFQQAVREGDWKGVRLKPGAPLELYNLASDAREEHNVARDHPDIVRKLEQRLRTCRTVTERWG